jgi:hypothetical protein
MKIRALQKPSKMLKNVLHPSTDTTNRFLVSPPDPYIGLVLLSPQSLCVGMASLSSWRSSSTAPSSHEAAVVLASELAGHLLRLPLPRAR